MKRVGSIFLVIFGICLILFGLLFILGAAGQTYRYVIAAVSLCLGAILTGLGIRFFKQADRLRPEYIRAEILKLAGSHNGEVSQADIKALLGERYSEANEVLANMCSQNLCQLHKRKTEIYYVFENLQPRLTVRRCEFCDTELPLDEELSSCPNCGGSIKTSVEKLSLTKGDYYSMDE